MLAVKGVLGKHLDLVLDMTRDLVNDMIILHEQITGNIQLCALQMWGTGNKFLVPPTENSGAWEASLPSQKNLVIGAASRYMSLPYIHGILSGGGGLYNGHDNATGVYQKGTSILEILRSQSLAFNNEWRFRV